jgi:hypothetical protein
MKIKQIFKLGKVLIAAGIINLFRKANGSCSFHGCKDYSWQIITISVILIVAGVILELKTKNPTETL